MPWPAPCGFHYADGHLMAEQVSLTDLADRYGTPGYVYSSAGLTGGLDALRSAFAPLEPRICFAVKSCPNLHILRTLRASGSGFDVVSGGELRRALDAGADPAQIVFAGVGKTADEIRYALEIGVGLLNVESRSELQLLERVAASVGIPARAALRINPEVDARTHAYTTTGTPENKFGVDLDQIEQLFAEAETMSHVQLRGLHVHIGSPITTVDAYAASMQQVLRIRDALQARGHQITSLDLGGGLPTTYGDRDYPPLRDFAAAVRDQLAAVDAEVVFEPGRVISANAGVLLTRVIHTKQIGDRSFVVVDASMNELLRPALYQAYHFIWPVAPGGRVPADWSPTQPFDDLTCVDVVGPICETSDFLAQRRDLPPVQQGDLLAVFSSGAYAMSMSSQYNSRPRACEVLVSGDRHRLIRARETYEDLVAGEASLSEDWE